MLCPLPARSKCNADKTEDEAGTDDLNSSCELYAQNFMRRAQRKKHKNFSAFLSDIVI